MQGVFRMGGYCPGGGVVICPDTVRYMLIDLYV